MVRIGLPALGVALLVSLVVDVFSTVFSARGLGGPVNRRQNRALWTLFRGFGTRGDGSVRSEWLALAGPVMVVTTVGVWVLWLVVGFALIYYPWIESFLVSPGTVRTPVLEVLYYSGYTAATLGFGDVVADAEALRLLAPVEALGGFALLSASVTYFLAVYRELIRKEALAAWIDSHFGSHERYGSPAVRDGEEGGREVLARWSESLSGSLSEVLLAHFQYPVLHYFRASKTWRSLPVQLGRLLDLRGLVRDADESQPLAALARHPSYVALQDALEKYLREVDELFTGGLPDASEREGRDPLGLAHRRLMDYMLHPSEGR